MTLRFVLTNVPEEREKEVIETLVTLVQKGIIEVKDIHMINEKELNQI